MINNFPKIFLSIACLVDSDVVDTIKDCLERAQYPERIIIGVCFQSNDDDVLMDQFSGQPRIKIIKINWKEAKGPTYARFLCSQLITDEDYFFQIDCHTRFYQNWDQILIEEYKKCLIKHPRPVISHYPINTNNMNNKQYNSIISHIVHYRYIGVDAIKTHAKMIKIPNEPLESWSISAAMFFTSTDTLKKVPYDPKLYFGYHGAEQFFYAVRLFTHGYQIFTPTRHTIATEYETTSKRVPMEVKKHLAVGLSKWSQQTWQKCLFYLRLDKFSNIKQSEYKEAVLNTSEQFGLGNVNSVDKFYEKTGITHKLLELFPYYGKTKVIYDILERMTGQSNPMFNVEETGSVHSGEILPSSSVNNRVYIYDKIQNGTRLIEPLNDAAALTHDYYFFKIDDQTLKEIFKDKPYSLCVNESMDEKKVVELLHSKRDLRTFYINLDRDMVKSQKMTAKLNRFGLDFERFAGTDGNKIMEELKLQGRVVGKKYKLRPGQVGCWWSHYRLWQKMVDEKIELSLIFEDDCDFVPNFSEILDDLLLQQKKTKAQIIFLGYCGASVDAKEPLTLLNIGFPRCTHAYLLTLEGAKILLNRIKVLDYPFDETLGRLFAYKVIKGLRTSHLLVYQPWQKKMDKYPIHQSYSSMKDLI